MDSVALGKVILDCRGWRTWGGENVKIQIWFDDQQIELVTECLKFTRSAVGEHRFNNVTKMTGEFFCRRIDEVLDLFIKKSKEIQP